MQSSNCLVSQPKLTASDSEVHVRECSGSDLDRIVSIHMEVFPGYRSTLLGSRFVRRLYQGLLLQPGSFGLVAECEGHVGGFVVGARLGSGPAITLYTASAAVQALIVRPRLLTQHEIRTGFSLRLRQWRPSSRRRIALPGEADLPTVTLSGIGVALDQRARGIGSRLVEAFETTAIQHGYGRACLSVRRDNIAANRLYQRRGWEEALPPPAPHLSIYAKLLCAERGGRP